MFRSLLLSKKYGRLWKKNAWKSGLLRKGRERRKFFAESAQSANRRQSRLRPSIGKGESLQPNGHSSGISSITPSQDFPSKRKSLPADLAEEHLRTAAARIPSNKRKRHDSLREVSIDPPIHSKTSHKRSSTVATHARTGGSSLKKARALIFGKIDTTRTDYFRLKALGVDPDTPLVPRVAQKRSPADVGHNKEEQANICLPFKHGSRSEGSGEAQGSGDTSAMTSQQPQRRMELDDDSDEALLAQMRSVRNTMCDSITWFREERAKNQLASGSGEERTSTETTKKRRPREIVTTPSRTEQRLRRTGAHGLLPIGWDPQFSWRNESGTISMMPASPCSDLSSTAASPPCESQAAPPASDLAAARMERKKADDHVTAKGTAMRATGSSVEDAIEL